MENITYLATTAVTTLVAGGAAAGATAAGGFWTITVAQLVPLAAALIAAGAVAVTLLVNAASTRRQHLTTLYGDALSAVSEYLEGPYRILRKDGKASTRFTIASRLSDVKTSIDHHQALLRLHAAPAVADGFDHYVTVAKTEAGQQMHNAWEAPPVTRDADVNLNDPLPRGASDNARKVVVEVMQAHLLRRWFNASTRDRFMKATHEVEEAVRQHALDRKAQAAMKAKAAATLATDAAQPAPHSRPAAPRSLARLARWLR